MKLSDKPETVADRHSTVPPERRAQIIGFLQKTDPDRVPYVLKTFRDNHKAGHLSAPELALIEELLGEPRPTIPAPAKAKAEPATDNAEKKVKK